MIDPSLRHEIKGLDELFSIIIEDGNLHDYKLESLTWNNNKRELTLVYTNEMWVDPSIGKTPHEIIFHIIPEWNSFKVDISPHDPFTYGIEIDRSDSQISKYRFEAEGSGPIVNCEDIWVEIKEGDSHNICKE